MKTIIIILTSSLCIVAFSCKERTMSKYTPICQDTLKMNDIEWQFYMYNIYFNLEKIPILDNSDMTVIDSLNITSSLFRRSTYDEYKDSTRVNYFFEPQDTSKKYVYKYANTLKGKKNSSIDFVITGDRLGYEVTSIDSIAASKKFNTYLMKNINNLHFHLYCEARKRGVIPDSLNIPNLEKENK